MAKKTKTVHTSSAKAVIAFLISLLGFTILILFSTNKDAILNSGNFKSLMTLIIVGMGLLVGLLYLVNAPSSSKKRK